jgi:hypothetical protein
MSDRISVLVIACSLISFINPFAGIALGVTVTWIYVKGRRDRARKAAERQQTIAYRADPANQAIMRGNGDNGGLSIEEANAYRRKANGR